MSRDLLAEPLTLRCGATLTNRLAKAAMTEGLADAGDHATEAHCVLYRRWAAGGAGLLITGNVMVDRRHFERPGNVAIDGPGGEEALRRWAEAGRGAGQHLWMQINHPGRQSHWASRRPPVGPSPVALELGPMFARPVAMTQAQIEDVIVRWAYVAGRAQDCGFTGVQIHAAHGYLMSQFLSPRVNRRDDRWGGSLEGRARLLLETVRAVRRQVGDAFPVSVKLNSSDFHKGAFSFEDCRRVARWLDAEGIDLLEISGGTYEQPRLLGREGIEGGEPLVRESTKRREAYFLEYAAEIQSAVQVPLMVTGGFRSRKGMTAALEAGAADVIGLARPLCVDPELPTWLLDGRVDGARRYEDDLSLGGRWTGPASPFLAFKIVNVQGEVAWFYRQIVRLADGEDADRQLGLLRGLAEHWASELRLARRRRSPG